MTRCPDGGELQQIPAQNAPVSPDLDTARGAAFQQFPNASARDAQQRGGLFQRVVGIGPDL
jgi:hypothetical protein